MNLSTLIEETLAKAEGGVLDSVTFFSALATTQPDLFTFLFDEDTRLLLEQEHDYLLFLSMILLDVLQQSGTNPDAIDLESLEDMSEYNWGLLEHTSIETITETVSRHPGYALYTFLEEACTPENAHDVLSEAAVELVYVKCKSLVDCAFLSVD
ncbi:MAG TPA: hypothetical protein VI603_08095 [Saprospiraceae bacterium]|nr:hypothetical protein [Saprospiraceae bacterium]